MNVFKKLCNWYFSHNKLPYICVLLIDCTCLYIAGLACYYLKHGGIDLVMQFWPVHNGLLLGVFVAAVAFVVMHTYRGFLRFSSFVDLLRIAYAVLATCVVLCIFHQIEVHAGLTQYIRIPGFKSNFYIAIIGTMLIWIVRIVVKSCYDTTIGEGKTKRIFIYGNLSGGIALAKSVRGSSNPRYAIKGFVSPTPLKSSTWMFGAKVYDDDDNLVGIMQKKHASIIMISPIQAEYFRTRNELIDELIKAQIKILMSPAAEEWDGRSELSFKQLHEVDIEDLLPRDKIEVDMNAIGRLLEGKRILITGAAGSIGSEMARQVARFSPAELILIDQAETPTHSMRLYMTENHPDIKHYTIVASICHKEFMEQIFAKHRPDYVFHAAAYKHVPMMEDNPAEAIRNNVYGTRVIADLAVKYGTKKFVMISTDKAVNPTNVMGCSKRICEIYCQALNAHQETTQFITTRFGNVLGSNGSVIPLFKKQIAKGGPVTVTHPNIIRFFMLIPEACRLVLEAGTMGKGGEIFVFDMGNPVRIADLAQRMIDLSGAKDVEIKYTGLRDGEKLYEEVLNDKETTVPTVHPKIMVAKVRQVEYEKALADEQELYQLALEGDDMAIVRKMKQIVPEYKSRHSKYEALDKENEM
ncbi:MAG: nucleoside-diphosphate sugar epimerase/dehydratase [Prevotellaceae bacterium]|nr:nucleoside-diphosphate sugar epimerase/dehydratase [Prevotellaceae bacterium]